METIKSNLNKAMRFALMFFIIATLATTFTACGDDNDDDEPVVDSALVGTWSFSGVDPYGDRVSTTMTFKKDGSMYIKEEWPDYPEDNYSATLSYSVTGDLSTGANLHAWGKVNGHTENVEYLATISGNKLTMIGLSSQIKGEEYILYRN